MRDELPLERAAAVPLQRVGEVLYGVFSGVIETEPRVGVGAEGHLAMIGAFDGRGVRERRARARVEVTLAEGERLADGDADERVRN